MYRHVTRTRQGKEPASADSGPWAVWADALFASSLQRSDNPSTGQIRQAIAAAVCAFGGPGCAERVAQEFGDHPETAAKRMRWIRQLADEAFASRASHQAAQSIRASAASSPPAAQPDSALSAA